MRLTLAAAALSLAVAGGTAGAATGLPPIVDPPTNLSIPGKFVWFDLVTGDPRAARSFYGKVFGWSFEAVPGGADYSLITAGDRTIGGVFQPAGGRGKAGTRWLSFVSVEDVGAAVSRLEELGFAVLLPATEVPGRGAQAVVRDPQGAVFGLMRSAAGDPADEPVGAGEFFWVDLYAHDAAAAAAAYGQVGFDTLPAGEGLGERVLLASNGYARAGITPLPADADKAGWLPYVQVDSVPGAVASAVAAGGKVLLPPDPLVLDGNVAVIGDPLGGVIGIIHWTRYAEDQEGEP